MEVSMKYWTDGIFESFLDDHKEFYEEYKDRPASPHTPRYSYIETTAEEEFNVHSLLRLLSNKELYFLYALMSEVGIAMLNDYAEEADC